MKKYWYEMSDDIHGIPVSRYIASWYIAGGKPVRQKIRKWLKMLIINGSPLTDEEVDGLVECVSCGKFELQESAKNFI